jgi:uncharacterized membrane protein YgcG
MSRFGRWGLSLLKGLSPLLLLAIPATAHADERILHYLSDVQIQKDSSIEVTETIDVRAEHDRINHGIYRDFPTRYRGRHGTQFHVGFTLEGATLDGAPVEASVDPHGNGVRIKLGDPDSTVAAGEHRYAIRYRATREIGRFPNFDELYWNATGNAWIFSIDRATVRIRLPERVRFGQRAVYTGAQGSTASDAEVIEEKPGDITFQTTHALGSYEGLTVAVAFPKGLVADAPSGSRLIEALVDYGPPLLGLLSFLGLCAFYYVAWIRAGRNPRAGTIVPLFDPPDGLTPAAMRYVTEMGADNRAFAAALVDMGVKGHIKIIDEDGGFFSSDTRIIERQPSETPLSEGEQEALDKLVQPGEQIEMKQKNHEKFSSAKKALTEILSTKYEGKLFKRNYGWAVAGLLIFAALFWLTCAAVAAATYGTVMWQIITVIGILVVTALLWLAFHDSIGGKCLLSLASVAAFGAAFFLGLPVLGAAFVSGWWLPIVLPVLAVPLVLSSFSWIAAPTPEGRKILDHIAGFKQYLSIAEGERLERMTPPADTPALFEKYLPFAIALAVENHWAKRFAGVLAAAEMQSQQGFAWYSGSSSPWSNPSSFAASVGSSLSSAVGSASTAPGSGGGGSSGGGGGGGGGGGW